MPFSADLRKKAVFTSRRQRKWVSSKTYFIYKLNMDKPFKINDVVWVFLTLAVIGLVYYLISNNIIPGPSAIIQKNITPTISLEQSPPPEGSQVACTLEAKICRDGVTVVGREGPDCEFAKCPG